MRFLKSKKLVILPVLAALLALTACAADKPAAPEPAVQTQAESPAEEKETAAETSAAAEKETAAETATAAEKETAAETATAAEKETAAETSTAAEKETAAETSAVVEKETEAETAEIKTHRLLYQGHGSLRIVTADNKVIYIDPYAGEGYDLPADLILVSHGHPDHNKVELIEKRNEDCKVIYNTDALVNGDYKIFDLGYAIVEAVQAGNNKNHDINVCVGWVITFPDGVSVYATGDTSRTEQMDELGEWDIHYAFFVCDGRFNMDMEEASACAEAVKARHSIPYHMAPGELFNRERAELFNGPGKMILEAGEEIPLY